MHSSVIISKTTTELLRQGFDNLNARRILTETHPENPVSNRVLGILCFIG